VHKKAKRIVKETLSNNYFTEEYATHAAEATKEQLRPLLDKKISNCYMAAVAEQKNKFYACNEEIKRLKEEKTFFQQLSEKATRIHTSVGDLQL
jgi:xanthine dehydrogenase iron-sulfur cluster and FAD-binding subunit A